MSMPVFLRVAQYVGFFATETCNLLLLYLILSTSSRKFGSYKYLLISFSCYSLLYGFVEILAQPVIHSKGASFIMFTESFLKYNKELGTLMQVIYCSSFGLCVSLLSAHFIYRYVAVCHPAMLYKIEGNNLYRLFIAPIIVSVIWFSMVDIAMAPSDIKSLYLKTSVFKYYQEDIFQIGYISMLYYYINEFGELIIDWQGFICASVCIIIMNLCIFTMGFCGLKTYLKMGSVTQMSRRTKDLNKQLFRTLIIQTLVPLITMFAPVGLLIILPMFSIGVGTIAIAPTIYAGFYPALDSCIAIFMIKDFRDALLCRKSKGNNGVSSTNETERTV